MATPRTLQTVFLAVDDTYVNRASHNSMICKLLRNGPYLQDDELVPLMSLLK